jgi:hypothetical protein
MWWCPATRADSGGHPHADTANWTFRIEGLAEQPMAWTWDQILVMPAPAYQGAIHCTTMWSKFDITFTGVSVDTLLQAPRPLPSANHIVAVSTTCCTPNLPLDDVTERQGLGGVHAPCWRRTRPPTRGLRLRSALISRGGLFTGLDCCSSTGHGFDVDARSPTPAHPSEPRSRHSWPRGAASWAERARMELRASRESRVNPPVAWEELTEQEWHQVQLERPTSPWPALPAPR